MSPLVKKEIRLLLPACLMGCALALTNLSFRFNPDGSLVGSWCYVAAFGISGAIAVMLALNSFGAEISAGTFSSLLAQPISRQKMWDTKIALLAAALCIFAVCWSSCGVARLMILRRDLDLLDLFSGVATFGLVVFSGGLWTVLLLRQVAAAFWFTLLVPGALMVLLAAFFAGDDSNLLQGLIVSVLGVYSLAGFFFARWLFFRAQDVHWSGGTIVLPEVRGAGKWFAVRAIRRARRPRAALWWKELQLQQSQFIIAFVLLVLHLGVLTVRRIYPLEESRDLKFALEIFWGLWLAMPLIIGCAAVAEERKLGTHEGQLCLPVTRRTQFGIKFIATLVLSLILGMIMPLLLEGARILPEVHFEVSTGLTALEFSKLPSSQQAFWHALERVNHFLPLLTFAGAVVAIAGVSFYVSSLVRNTLQSLAPAAVGLLLVFFLALVADIPSSLQIEYLWNGPLVYFICVPLLATSVAALAYWNFRHIRTGWRMVGVNFLVLLCAIALGVTATTAIFHRGWEKLSPFEPSHGAARLTLANPPVVEAEGGVSVLLPDGKFWQAFYGESPTSKNPLDLLLGNLAVRLEAGKYFTGSLWRSVVRIPGEFAGIKTDGTLWVSDQPLPPASQTSGQSRPATAGSQKMVRFGSETNWSGLERYGYSLLLVKDDGTLWQWGPVNFNDRKSPWPGLRSFSPRRLGVESNWAKVFRNAYRICLQKSDGAGWIVDNWQTNGIKSVEIEAGFTVHAVPELDRDKFRSTAQIGRGPLFMVGVESNGTFRVWAEEYLVWDAKHNYGNYQWRSTDLPIGAGTNWLAVAGSGEKIVTLKNDGTLWLWDFHQNRLSRVPWDQQLSAEEVQRTVPTRLGAHSDWVAMDGNWNNVVSLAADGSLWFWELGSVANYNDSNRPSSIRPILEYSRKPQLLGNIFDGSN